MAKKYDTNPLDRDVSRRAEAARTQFLPDAETAPQLEQPTKFFEAATRSFADVPTQPFAAGSNDFDNSYQSVLHRPPPLAPTSSVSRDVGQIIQPPTARKVLGLGLPENVLMILPYLPAMLGAIAAVVELLFVSRAETRVRFHAAQALALHFSSWIIGAFLAFFGSFTFVGGHAGRWFQVAVTIYFIVSIFRVWRGKPNHIAALDDITDFLNEKIKPQNGNK